MADLTHRPIVQRRKSDAAITIKLTTEEAGLLHHILTRALENPEHFGATDRLDPATKARLVSTVKRIRNQLADDDA